MKLQILIIIKVVVLSQFCSTLLLSQPNILSKGIESITFTLDSLNTLNYHKIETELQVTFIEKDSLCYARFENGTLFEVKELPIGSLVNARGSWSYSTHPISALTLHFTEANGYKKINQKEILILREKTDSTIVATTTKTFGSTAQIKQFAIFLKAKETISSFNIFLKEFASVVSSKKSDKILSYISEPFFSHDVGFLCSKLKKKQPASLKSEFSHKELKPFLSCLFTKDVIQQMNTYDGVRMEREESDDDFFGVSYTYTFPFYKTKNTLIWFTFGYSTISHQWKLVMTDNVSFDTDEE